MGRVVFYDLAMQEERGEVARALSLLHVVGNNDDRVGALEFEDQVFDL